jgi:hypothetical protein
MPQARIAPLLLLLAALTSASCNDTPLSSSIARLSTAPTAAVDLTGTWTGSAIDSLGRTDVTWQLTQRGTNVTGTVAGTTNVGAPVYTGSVSGTVSAAGLRFTMTVPAGSMVDLPDCSLNLTGTVTDIQAGSMAGTYTGTHSCIGAIEAGRLLLVR